MKYDFDKVWQRTGNDAMKWEFPRHPMSSVHSLAPTIIPMWVADMDFATPECINDAMKKRMEHPIYGYFGIPDRFFSAVNHWQKTRYGLDTTLTRQNIMYQNSVLGAVASFITAYSQPGENILVHSTVYNGFQSVIKNLGRNICTSDLLVDKEGIYRINFEDMEQKILKNKISVMLFCSPHNPTGRVWEEWEILKVVELCDKYDIKLISDEIWADFITDPTCKHIPTQSVCQRAKEITMAIYAPSKTFNIAGLVGAYSIIYNQQIANKVSTVSVSTHYNQPNILSCYALIGGYEDGADWVDEMNCYIRANQEYVVKYLTENFKGIKAYLPQSTYLLWIDIRECGKDNDVVFKELLEVGVLPTSGKTFLGDGFLRFNLACPKSLCEDAMSRLDNIFLKK